MKRANWTYLVATALVLSTGVSVAGAKARHHDKHAVRAAVTADFEAAGTGTERHARRPS